MNACAKGCFVCLRTFRRRRPEKKRDIDASLFTMRCSVWSFIRRSIILFLVSALHVFVSVHLAPSLSLMKGSTQIALFFFFFPGLTYTNVLMDRGDKDNEGEERGDEEWRREGQYATHTRTHTNTHRWGGKFSREADFVGMKPTSVGRERAEGDMRVRGSGEEERKATRPEERRRREALVERMGW